MDMNDLAQIRAELEKIEAALQSLASLLSGEALAAAQKPLLEHKAALLHGAGAIAQGAGAKAVGQGGVLVEGDLYGNIYTGKDPGDDAKALEIYCRMVKQTTASLPLRGVDVGASDPTLAQKIIGLANVYVDLDTTAQIQKKDEAGKKKQKKKDEDALPDLLLRGEKEAHALPVLDAVIQNHALVLQGDPGGGKSTFVNFLAHCLAAHALQSEAGWLEHLHGWPQADSDLLPIPIVLRDFAHHFAENLPARAEPCHIWDFVVARLKAQNLSFADSPLCTALEDGRAIVLFDGLDEVPTQAQRIFVRDAVRAFVGRYPQNRFLITCRVLSYQPPEAGKPDLRLSELPEFTIAPFDEEKIERFVVAWYAELARLGTVLSTDVDAHTARLREAVRRPDLRRLAHNPLLLTVMALVHTHKGRLPDARALLYEETVDILLSRWEQMKLGGQEDAPRLRQHLLEANRTDVDLKRVLWELAFQAHEAARPGDNGDDLADIPEHRLLNALAALKCDESCPDGDLNWARRVADLMKIRSGLLLERQPGSFTFPHRTFQEYMAGAHLAAQIDFAVQAQHLSDANSALWREAILYAAGKLVYVNGDVAKALTLAAELCPETGDDSDAGWKQAWLAGDALLEIGLQRVRDNALGRDLHKRVQHRLRDLLESGKLAPLERARAGDTLAKLGDPRLEVTTIEGMQFCLVPPGPFVMGGNEYDYEKPQHPNDCLRDPYWIARYPVTVAKWRAFVEATQFRPGDTNSLRDPDNRPVRRVSWYEALEFCKWLNSQYATRLPEGYAFGLPSEAEWEKAARGGLQVVRQPIVRGLSEGISQPGAAEMIENPFPKREYPWQGAFDPNQANTSETGIGTTSAVGCFAGGVSPYGILDASGNVWEWTRSLWGKDWQKPDYKYPYDPIDGREKLDTDRETSRVLRGGSFDYDARLARCAFRLRYLPDHGDGLIGFRLVVSRTSLHSDR